MKRIVLVCDSSRARLLASMGRHEPLQLVWSEDNPQGRAIEQDLRSDESGRLRKGGRAGVLSAMDPNKTAHEVEAERFAHHLAGQLKSHLESHAAYDGLVIAAPAHFLGLLRELLAPEVRDVLKDSVPKDLTKMSERELRDEVGPLLWPGS
jgi:protein required for attachment to host cells